MDKIISYCETAKLEEIEKRVIELQAHLKQLQAEKKNLMEALNYECPEKYPDNCTVCKGANAGVRGNENIIDDVVMCDYCSISLPEAE